MVKIFPHRHLGVVLDGERWRFGAGYLWHPHSLHRSPVLVVYVVRFCYLGTAKSSHKRDGITYEAARATGFLQDDGSSENSPPI